MIFGPEAAADKRRDDADLRLEQTESSGQAVANRNRRLRRVPDRQLFRLRVPMREHGAVLDRRRRAAVVEKAAVMTTSARALRAGVVALSLHDVCGGVGLEVLVHRGAAAFSAASRSTTASSGSISTTTSRIASSAM